MGAGVGRGNTVPQQHQLGPDDEPGGGTQLTSVGMLAHNVGIVVGNGQAGAEERRRDEE